jgi:S-adenosylmethionine synthetase
MPRIKISNPTRPNANFLPVEIVERKGMGHPDSIADRAAEELSIALSKRYLEAYGRILHHNVDKCVLVGGRTEPEFGGGKLLDPIEIILVGRATPIDGQLDMLEFAQATTLDWIATDLPRLVGSDRLVVDARIRAGSLDLQHNYDASQALAVPRANDTSFGVGYWPLSDLEKVVLDGEHVLNSFEFKQEHPEIGTDIKIMGLRQGDELDLTVACAMVASELPSRAAYDDAKALIEQTILDLAQGLTHRACKVSVNTADDPQQAYLTITGTSAEAGDDGQVGRGNRPNGLITPYRPMTLEAACGKNPVSHVGKIYSVMAQLIAERVEDLEPVTAAQCYMLSRIGHPINEPNEVNVEVEAKAPAQDLEETITAIVQEVLADWKNIQLGFLERKWRLF